MLTSIPVCLLIVLTQSLRLTLNPSDLYLNNDELDAFAQDIATSNSLQMDSCDEDPRIKYYQLGSPEAQMHAIIICNIHAREAITSEICLNWVKNYYHPNDTLWKSIDVKLFYDSNVNRRIVFEGHPQTRKGESGVDLNRNFPTEFDFYKVQPSDEIYGGQKPISEPLNICLERLIERSLPTLFLDIHSGGNGEIFYQKGVNGEAEMEVIDSINRQICDSKCRITTLQKDGQAINGHIFADVKVRKQVKYSILYETYGNQENKKGIFFTFNPSLKRKKNEVIEKWSKGIQLTIEEVVAHQTHQY